MCASHSSGGSFIRSTTYPKARIDRMGVQPESSSSADVRTPLRKRKVPAFVQHSDDQGDRGPDEDERPNKSRKKDVWVEEKRLRRFRARPPQDFAVVYDRAISQRFYILGRTRAGAPHCPEEFVELTGSTGNIYVVHVTQRPTCTCPHARKGHQCKHIIYVLSRVLHARFQLVYQLALLTTELREIFENAPPIKTGNESGSEAHDKNRKPLDGDCPICFTPFDAVEATMYCRATCGQNIHKECFEMWAATKRSSSRDQVTCPMCRTPWEGDDDMVRNIKDTGVVGSDGYVNVADQLGISRQRDRSTYYNGPRRGAYRYSGIRW